MSTQTKLKDPKQISFIGRILNTCGTTMFSVIEKSEETTFEFLLDCKFVKVLKMKIQNFEQKNVILLKVSYKVIIHMKIQLNF